jgi:hypothetical protein
LVGRRFNAALHLRDIIPICAIMCLPAFINNNLGLAGVIWRSLVAHFAFTFCNGSIWLFYQSRASRELTIFGTITLSDE